MSNIYSALPLTSPESTRFFTFVQGEDPQSLEIALVARRQSECTKYTALSYTWERPFGNPSLDEEYRANSACESTIICNGRPLRVLRNLFEALLVLRHSKHKACILWADAICINQTDESEVDQQVRIMAKIYKDARVIVWLGESDGHAESALPLMNALSELNLDNRRGVVPSRLSTTDVLQQDFRNTAVWRSLACFFCRRWFNRAWVIQEVLSTSEIAVLCGRHELRWESLGDISAFISTGPWGKLFQEPGFSGIVGPHQSYFGGPAKLRANALDRSKDSARRITNALIRARRYECKLGKDKVFCLIGMERTSEEGNTRSVQVEYSWSDRDVFAQTAINILEVANDLLLLYCAEGSHYRSIQGLPSWVPDWTVPETVGLGITGYERFDATKDIKRHLVVHRSPDGPSKASLELKGVRIDTISMVGESKKQIADHKGCEEWLRLVCSLGPTYLRTGEPTVDVFWRTVITNTWRGDGNAVQAPPPQLRLCFSHWLAWATARYRSGPADQSLIQEYLATLEDWGLTMPSDADIDVHEASEIAHLFQHNLCLRLFRTDDQYLGIGTTSLEIGDEVWLIAGARVPLIFRHAGASVAQPRTRTMELIGGCYLHGVMSGEATPPNEEEFEKIIVV